jgi:hypothetical protein
VAPPHRLPADHHTLPKIICRFINCQPTYRFVVPPYIGEI